MSFCVVCRKLYGIVINFPFIVGKEEPECRSRIAHPARRIYLGGNGERQGLSSHPVIAGEKTRVILSGRGIYPLKPCSHYIPVFPRKGHAVCYGCYCRKVEIIICIPAVQRATHFEGNACSAEIVVRIVILQLGINAYTVGKHVRQFVVVGYYHFRPLLLDVFNLRSVGYAAVYRDEQLRATFLENLVYRRYIEPVTVAAFGNVDVSPYTIVRKRTHHNSGCGDAVRVIVAIHDHFPLLVAGALNHVPCLRHSAHEKGT